MTDISRLVVNGCSYMNYYARGQGHQDLADRLGIEQCVNLAKNSVCNQRILRTTCQDLYAAQSPTLYVIGITMLSRFELPIVSQPDSVDGHWKSFNGFPVTCQDPAWYPEAQADLLTQYTDLYLRFFNARDCLEDLMYQIMNLISTAHARGHRVLIFNTAEHSVHYWIQQPQFDLLRSTPVIIDGLTWSSIVWQFEQGAGYPPEDECYPWDCRHVAPGDHAHLNDFLVDYIHTHRILL